MDNIKIIEQKKVKLSHKEVDSKLFWELIGVYAILALIFLGAYYIAPGITGFVTVTKQSNYTDDINIDFKQSAVYDWRLAHHGGLRSINLDGSLIGNGTAKVYLENNGEKYLVFDSASLVEKPSGMFGITAFAVKDKDKSKNDNNNETQDKSKQSEKENNPPEWTSDESSFILNGSLSINLSSYFTDKDNDSLIYSAGSILNVSASIDKDIITFIPEENINDARNAVIAASDGKTITYKSIELVIHAREANLILSETPFNEAQNNETKNKATNETEEKRIAINLKYDDDAAYDANNDGVESLKGVVDITSKASSFNWPVDASKLCARYEIYSVENKNSQMACFGGSECCSLVDLENSKDSWNATLYLAYGYYGSAASNIEFGQVLYADYNLSSDNPHYEAVYSKWANLTANFVDNITEFENVCIDSCALKGNDTSYKLIIELENVELKIKSIGYTLEEKAANEDPILLKEIENLTIIKHGDYSIDLSKYFADNDKDKLTYTYLDMENVAIVFENNLANIIPGKDFTGVRFTYIGANDSYGKTISNVFRIEVKEKEKPAIEILDAIEGNESMAIAFKTAGMSNLTITPVDGASFVELYSDNISTSNSLEPLTLKCGDFEIFDKANLLETNNSGFSIGNSSKLRLSGLVQESLPIKNIHVEDYSCNDTSYYELKLLDSSNDIQELSFGNDTVRVTFALDLKQKFEVRDISGNTLATIDSFGNMQLKGILMQGMLNVSAPNSFVLYSPASEINLIIENPTGNLYLKGALNQNQSASIPTPNSFVIKNKKGEAIAYVSNEGNLFLKGSLKENTIFS